MASTQAALKPNDKNTARRLIQQQTQHLQDVTWVMRVTEQTAPLLRLVCYESSMIKLPLSAEVSLLSPCSTLNH